MPGWVLCRTHLDLGSQVPKIVSQADDLIVNGTESIESIAESGPLQEVRLPDTASDQISSSFAAWGVFS